MFIHSLNMVDPKATDGYLNIQNPFTHPLCDIHLIFVELFILVLFQTDNLYLSLLIIIYQKFHKIFMENCCYRICRVVANTTVYTNSTNMFVQCMLILDVYCNLRTVPVVSPSIYQHKLLLLSAPLSYFFQLRFGYMWWESSVLY